MNHEEITDLLHNYVRGRLNDEQRLVVQQALEKNPSLEVELESVRAYYKDLKGLPEVKAPDDFLLKVRDRIDRKGFWEKIRELAFFPLQRRLPVEIAGTIAVSLLVIMIFNPFSPKIHVNMQEKSVATIPEAEHDINLYNTNENKVLEDAMAKTVEKKKDVPEPAAKAGKPVASFQKSRVRKSIPPEGSFAEPMPSAVAVAPRTTSEDMVINSGGTDEPDKESADRVDEAQAIGIGKSKAAAIEPLAATPSSFKDVPASAPTASSAPALSASATLMDQQSSPVVTGVASREPPDQIAYTWTPDASAAYESPAEKDMAPEIQTGKKVMRSVQTEKSSVSMNEEVSKVSDKDKAYNKLKSDNLQYLKTSVTHAGGSLKVLNKEDRQYRIKIPAKNFRQFENELNSGGIFLPDKAVDASRFSSKEILEIVITIKE